MISALVSQSRGFAVFDDGKLPAALLDAESEPLVLTERELSRLLRGAHDIEALVLLGLSELRVVLRERRLREQVLHATLLFIDGQSSRSLRATAGATLIRLAAPDAIVRWVECVLMSVPAPAEADFTTAWDLPGDDRIVELLHRIESCQSRIRSVFASFVAVCRKSGVSAWSPLRRRAVQDGWFRALVLGERLLLGESDEAWGLVEQWIATLVEMMSSHAVVVRPAVASIGSPGHPSDAGWVIWPLSPGTDLSIGSGLDLEPRLPFGQETAPTAVPAPSVPRRGPPAIDRNPRLFPERRRRPAQDPIHALSISDVSASSMTYAEAKDLPAADIEAALADGGAAFRRFYRHYDPTVRRAVGLRVYRWRELAPLYEDVVQEVWAQLVRRDCKVLRYYKQGRDVPFSRFLAFVSSGLGWRLAKKHLRHPNVELVEVHDVPEDEELGLMARMLSENFLAQLLARARERLDHTDFVLLEGYYVDDEPIHSIAYRLGINENAAYQRHQRLRKKLADLLEELLGQRPRSAAELVAML